MQAKRILTTAALVVAAMFIIGVPAADATTYYVVSDGNWTQQIWNTTDCGDAADQSNPSPGTGDIVRVCPGVELTITAAKSAGSVYLEAGNSAGDLTKIIISTGGTLTLSGTAASTLNNFSVIELTALDSVLANTDTHDIANGASSGFIDGQDNAAQITVASDKILTSQTLIAGQLKIAPTGTFRNDGPNGIVQADGVGTIEMAGTGTIDGDGDWKVISNASAVLKWSLETTGLTGAFTVSAGLLDINQNVCTTGELTFDGGTVDVVLDKSFKASGSCP